MRLQCHSVSVTLPAGKDRDRISRVSLLYTSGTCYEKTPVNNTIEQTETSSLLSYLGVEESYGFFEKFKLFVWKYDKDLSYSCLTTQSLSWLTPKLSGQEPVFIIVILTYGTRLTIYFGQYFVPSRRVSIVKLSG